METFKAILFFFLAIGILGVIAQAVETSSTLGAILILGGFFLFCFINSYKLLRVKVLY